MTTLTVGIERLTALVDHVANVQQRNWFCFGVWAGRDWKGNPDLSCGTNRCALGEATTMPLFQKLGLALKKDMGLLDPTYVSVVLPTLNGRQIIRLADRKWAAAKLFGISVDYWDRLFIPSDFEPPEGELTDSQGRLYENATAEKWVAHARGIIKELQQKEA